MAKRQKGKDFINKLTESVVKAAAKGLVLMVVVSLSLELFTVYGSYATESSSVTDKNLVIAQEVNYSPVYVYVVDDAEFSYEDFLHLQEAYSSQL